MAWGWRRGNQQIEIHVYHHFDDPGVVSAIMAELKAIKRLVTRDVRLDEAQMADLTRLTADVAANRDATESAVTLLGNIAQALRDAGTDPVALAALADQLEADNTALAAAVVANTPADTSGGTTTGGSEPPTG